MAVAVVSIFAGANANIRRYALLSSVFMIISIPCLGVWATVGSRVGPVVRSGTVARAFNLLLGAALLASARFGIWEQS